MPAGRDAQLGIAPVLAALDVGVGKAVDCLRVDAFESGCQQQALALDGGVRLGVLFLLQPVVVLLRVCNSIWRVVACLLRGLLRIQNLAGQCFQAGLLRGCCRRCCADRRLLRCCMPLAAQHATTGFCQSWRPPGSSLNARQTVLRLTPSSCAISDWDIPSSRSSRIRSVFAAVIGLHCQC